MKQLKPTLFKRTLYFAVFQSIVLLFASCYTHRDTTLLQESQNLPVYEKAAYVDYKIMPNDELMFVVVSQNEDLVGMLGSAAINSSSASTNSYRVFPDGIVDLPFIDTVKIAGLTINQAAKKIEAKYRKVMAPDAEVKLSMVNKTYTVIGDAGTGIFPYYKDKLTIYQALAQSGQIQLSGDRKRVKIVRENASAKPQILEFDIRPKSVIDSKYYYIYPNDIIYVQRAPSSFYKVNNYSAFLGLITSSVSLFITVFYFNKR